MKSIKNRIKNNIIEKLRSKQNKNYIYSNIDIKDIPERIASIISKEKFDIKGAKNKIYGEHKDNYILTLIDNSEHTLIDEQFDIEINIEEGRIRFIECDDCTYKKLAEKYFSNLFC